MRFTEILIIHLNGKEVLDNCIKSIYEDNRNAKVRVLFNNTTDGSDSFIIKKYASIIHHSSSKTLGFAEASNFLAKKAKSRNIIFLNNDTIVGKNWLKELEKTMKRHKSCIAVQPKVKSYFKRENFEYAGAAGGFIDKYGFPFCRGRIFNTIEKDKNQYNEESKIFWACGVCMLVNREFFIKSGGFDESLYMYAEEIDFCWRANVSGKEIWYSPKSSIYHIGSFSVRKEKINRKKEHLITRNHLIIFLKNHKLSSLFFLFPIRLILELVATLRFPKKKAISLVFSLFSVPYYFLSGGLEKRRIVQNSRKSNFSEINKLIYQKSIALDYFLKRKQTFKELKFSQVS